MTTLDRADAAPNSPLTRYPLFLFSVLSFILTWGYFWLIVRANDKLTAFLEAERAVTSSP
jgi:hypothetical protein